MKRTNASWGDVCAPAQLKRMALQRLRERLEEDQMTTAELLKVAALPEPDTQSQAPTGEWTISLAD